jgi:hypothetical protein
MVILLAGPAGAEPQITEPAGATPMTSIAPGQATRYDRAMYWITQKANGRSTGLSAMSAKEALVTAEGLLQDGNIVISHQGDIITLEQLRLDAGEAVSKGRDQSSDS